MFLSPTPKGMGGFTESWSDGSPHPAALATLHSTRDMAHTALPALLLLHK